MCRQLPAATTVGVTGSSGLVGSALVSLLTAGGHRAVRLRRNKGAEPSFQTAEDRLDAVVHLAGEPLASGRWNAAKKSLIRASRVAGTRALCESLVQMTRPPKTLVCASAIGYYGSRGDDRLDEASSPGDGFLPDVVRAWEQAAGPAMDRGIRVVFLRFGMILSAAGGSLAKMLPPFRYGLGGRIGTGRQYWSWISLDDALGAICHALAHEGLAGPVNAVAPRAVTNAEFTSVLGRVLGRPAFAAMPAWAARIVFGQMADELLLASARVVPRRLQETGFEFRHGELRGALQYLLGIASQ